MTSTIQGPAWATKHEGTSEGQQGWFERDLIEPFDATGVGDEIDTLAGPEDLATATLVLDPSGSGTPHVQLSGAVQLAFKWPESMRAFASALHRCANEWERIENEDGARAYIAAAEGFGLPHGLTERQINGRDMVSVVDVVLFARRHGIDAGAFANAITAAFASSE